MWKIKIKQLIDAGLTQVEIAAHCSVSQGLISQLFHGKVESLNWEAGDKLNKLHGRIMRKKKRETN